MDADAISRLLQYDDRGDFHQLEAGPVSVPVSADMDRALLRKMLLDRDF